MIVDCEQGSEAWHGLRYGKITATRLANILGVGYDSPLRTWELMTGRRPEQSASRAMTHGAENESVAAAEFSWRMDVDLAEVGTVIHDRYPFLSASPDRLVGAEALLEVKCPWSNGLPTSVEGINPGYCAQVALQLACMDDREKCYLMHYVAPGKPLVKGGDDAGSEGAGVVHLLVRDERLEGRILDYAAGWYGEHIVRGTPPERGRVFPFSAEELRSMVREEVLRW